MENFLQLILIKPYDSRCKTKATPLKNALIELRYKKQLWILGQQGWVFSVLKHLGQFWFLGLWYMPMDLRTKEWSRPAEKPLFCMVSSFLFSKSCEWVWEKLEYYIKKIMVIMFEVVGLFFKKKIIFSLFFPIIMIGFLVLKCLVDVVLDLCYPSM